MPPCLFTAGIDASDFDWDRGPMDVGAAVRDGISFLTAKATEGTRVQHVHYGQAMNRAAAAGMPLMGAYVVPRTPGNNGHGSIQAQVNYFLAYLDAQTPWWRGRREFFLQVDLEHWGYDDVAAQHGVEMCRLLRAAAPGKWVVLYAPRWAYGDSIPGNDPLWASAYGNNPALPYRQAYRGDNDAGWNPYSGRTPIILQYGSATRIGTQPTCDANAYRGTLAELRALITGGDDMAGLDQATIDGLRALVVEYKGSEVSPRGWLARALESALNTLMRAAADEKIRDTQLAAALAGTQALVEHMATAITSAGGNVELAAIQDFIGIKVDEVKTRAEELYLAEKTADEQRHNAAMAAVEREHNARVASLQAELDKLRGTAA